jgi:hypothetical protein
MRSLPRVVRSYTLILVALLGFAALGGCAGEPARVYGYTRATLDTELRTGSYASRMTRTQEEAIIANAIAAHEMRRP